MNVSGVFTLIIIIALCRPFMLNFVIVFPSFFMYKTKRLSFSLLALFIFVVRDFLYIFNSSLCVSVSAFLSTATLLELQMCHLEWRNETFQCFNNAQLNMNGGENDLRRSDMLM